MTILAVIGDVHARGRTLAPVLEAIDARGVDGILLVGDLGSSLPARREPKEGVRRRYLNSVRGVLHATRALGVPLAYVPGNHDLPDLDFEGNADRRQLRIAGLRVVGIGGSPDHRGFPYEFDEEEVRSLRLPEADVLLCHTPPARTALDRVPRRDAHVGSEAIRERAEAHDGVLVCGHIHESPGVVQLEACTCFNVGGLGRPYGRAQVGFVTWSEAEIRCEHLDLEQDRSRLWIRQDRWLIASEEGGG